MVGSHQGREIEPAGSIGDMGVFALEAVVLVTGKGEDQGVASGVRLGGAMLEDVAGRVTAACS